MAQTSSKSLQITLTDGALSILLLREGSSNPVARSSRQTETQMPESSEPGRERTDSRRGDFTFVKFAK